MKKILLALALSALSTSSFAAIRSSANRLPLINENLKLRSPAFGKAYVLPIQVLKLPGLAALTLTLTDPGTGSGKSGRLDVDAALLSIAQPD